MLVGCILLVAPAQATILAPGAPIPEDFVLGPTVPGKWGPPGFGNPGGLVTWSLMGPGIPTPFDDGPTVGLGGIFPVGFVAQIQAAFDAWEAVANIQFMQVADNGLPFNAGGAVGDIRIGAHAFDGPGGVLAHGFFPPVNGVSAAGDIHFDAAELWKIGFGGPGFDIFQVAAHEIGHAIGLDHTAVPMSLMNPFYTETFSGPQADDIAGAQFIYGQPQEAPEPATLLLMGLGLAAVAARRARGRA
jgi:hypothetical protein